MLWLRGAGIDLLLGFGRVHYLLLWVAVIWVLGMGHLCLLFLGLGGMLLFLCALVSVSLCRVVQVLSLCLVAGVGLRLLHMHKHHTHKSSTTHEKKTDTQSSKEKKGVDDCDLGG